MKKSVNWSRIPLAEAFWFQEGPGVRKWQFTTSGVKLLNVGNIEKDGTLNLSKTDRSLDEAEVARKYGHFLVNAGDLVIASSGVSFDDDGLLRTRGAFVRERDLPLCLNTSTIRFKAVEGVSDLRFLRLWLSGTEFRSQITKLVTGTAQQNFGPSHLKATNITLPPLPEQQRIAKVFDRAEALRAKRRAAIAQLDAFTNSVFCEQFGDPLTNPNGLKTAKLGALCKRITDGTHQPPNWAATGHPFLFVSNIISGEINLDTQKFISDETYNCLTRRCPIEKGDVLYSTVGSYGVPAIVRTSGKFAFQRHIAHLKPNRDLLDSEFLRAMLASEPLRKQADRVARGVAQKTVNLADISRFVVFCPPVEAQREFARQVAKVEKVKGAQRASLADIDALLAALQFRAFSGGL